MRALEHATVEIMDDLLYDTPVIMTLGVVWGEPVIEVWRAGGERHTTSHTLSPATRGSLAL